MIERGLGRPDRLARHVGRLQQRDPLVARAFEVELAHGVEVRLALLVLAERRRHRVDLHGVAAEVGQRDGDALGHGVEPPAVAGLEAGRRGELLDPPQLVQRRRRAFGALPHLRHPEQRALSERRLDPVAAASPRPRHQRGADPRRREQRGAEAGQRRVQVDGTRSESGLLVLEAETGLHQAVDPRAVAMDAVPPVSGDRAVHEAVVVATQGGIVDTQSCGRAGRERLDEHVGVAHEMLQRGHAVGCVEVQHDAALAAVPHDMAGRASHRVAAGRLDLDHRRTAVGQQHGGDGARGVAGQVEDGETLERQRHRIPLVSGSQ